MPIVNIIALSKLKIHPTLNDAPLGAILYVSVGNGTSTVMRASVLAGAEDVFGVVSLEGDDAGHFYSDAELDNPSVINISNLVDLALSEPTPIRFGRQQPMAGVVVEARGEISKFLCLSIYLPHRREIVGYMHLEGERAGQITAIGLDRIGLGRVAVIVKPDKHNKTN